MSEKLFYMDMNLQQNELKNAVIQNLAAAPTSPAPIEGQLYQNTTDNTLYCYDGTEWVSVVHHDLTIKAGSTDYLDITNHELSLKQLAITSVTVEGTEASLADYLTTVDYATNHQFDEGDVIILTAVTDNSLMRWIHHGGTAYTAADFTALDTVLTASEVRGYLSGTDGVTYDSGTGAISADVDDTTIQVGASGLEVKDSSITQAKLDATLEAKIVTSKQQTFGDGVLTSFTFTHNLNTPYISVTTYNTTTKEEVSCYVSKTSDNELTIGAFPAFAQDELLVIVDKKVIS